MATSIKIVEQYNETIKHIQRAHDYSLKGHIADAQKELEKASTCIYQTIEWSIKIVLGRIYNDPSSNQREIGIIDGNGFHPKVNLFRTSAQPSPTSKGIDLEIIKDLKKIVRNNPEHSGYTPHYNSLLEVINETKKIVSNYIDVNAVLKSIPAPIDDVELESDSSWSEFYAKCDSFSSLKNHILIIGPISSFSKDKLSYLGLLEWDLIIDFDPNTEIDGFYYNAFENLDRNRKVHLLTSHDGYSFSHYNATYWLAAKGLKGRQNTLTNDYRRWTRANANFLSPFFTSFFQAFGDKPTNVVIVWDQHDYIQRICQEIDASNGEKSKFIYAIQELSVLSHLTEIYEGESIEISIPKIADGVLRIRNFKNSIDQYLRTLPSKDQEFISIEDADFRWISEDFEIVHRNLLDGVDLDENNLSDKDRFFKGDQITWSGLHLGHDVRREKTDSIKRKLEKLLRGRGTEKIILSHHPGIGGTTISRRVAWELKNDFPVLILKNFRPTVTVDKIYRVFELTKQSVLIVIDTSVLNSDETERLINELLSRNFPCVSLVTQRKDQARKGDFYIDDILTDLEFQTFITKYKELIPEKSIELNNLLQSILPAERHPFYIGLTAFEENFEGLKNFVKKNLITSTEVQKKALSIIALCYYYGQKPTSSQLFSSLFMTSENSVIKIEEYINENLMSMLINTEDIKWRPLHYLVAQELLIQLLSGNNQNNDSWRYNLVDLAIDLIKLMAHKSSIPSDNESELLKRLFVYRDNQEVLGKEEESSFSNFMENGLKSDESRLRIFLQLTESFPESSHFWAHLARFYSLKMKSFEKALIAINNAIDLSKGKDSLLFHMKGMCLRSIANDKMRSLRHNQIPSTEEIREIYDLVDDANLNFEECRGINPYNQHGYISDIQLLINTIDFGFKTSKYQSRSEHLRNLNPWYQEKLDLAEKLLEDIRLYTKPQENNQYIEECDIKVQELYENFSSVIEGWNNLLSKSEGNKAIIRRSLIRAYVRRADSWNTIEMKDIEKILKLIQENLKDEPDNGHNIFLWFQAARQTSNIDLNTAIDKISNWRTSSDSDESLYYLGVLHTIQAINGTSASVPKAEKLIQELSERKRNTPYRTHCYEWYGNGSYLGVLIPFKTAVIKEEGNEYKFIASKLKKVKGKISAIKGPEAGSIELSCGLSAFFVPARAIGGLSKDKDVNKNVTFYLGFSNNGLRAYEVELDSFKSA